eukprot:NODE_4117_length_860_cov_37.648582_g3799_i0.p1 GENE.NODE_4117_length_860_cov_37.648582_g3799_i0~~NODE_4117_length_860_cov_37.648582_g3799_i0.p1  ORF type:complete len:204 (-),score=42.29 NODE_4117_length_860_cov_37.648582_g3799_i0:141-752(-)
MDASNANSQEDAPRVKRQRVPETAIKSGLCAVLRNMPGRFADTVIKSELPGVEQITWPKQRKDSKPVKFCFVQFSTVEHAEAARAKGKLKLKGASVQIEHPREKEPKGPPPQVVLPDVPQDADDAAIEAAFKAVKLGIEKVNWPKRRNDSAKRVCFVHMKSEKDVEKALAGSVNINGKAVECEAVRKLDRWQMGSRKRKNDEQ